MTYQFYETNVPEEHAWLGHPNALPPNFTRISQDDYWASMLRSLTPQFCTGRYITRVRQGHSLMGKHLTMFVFEDRTAVGYIHNYQPGGMVTPKVFFKAYDCAHNMQSTVIGKCLRLYQCTKCTYNYTLDSSG